MNKNTAIQKKETISNLYDTLIVNAIVFDGSGATGIQKDVALKGDRIIAIGQLNPESAADVIDAEGLILAPGFIDVHTHDDLEVLRNPQMLNKISQGVTSVIIGNCGISASPYAATSPLIDPINLLGTKNEFIFPQLKDFIDKFNTIRPHVNVAALIGHTSLRAQVMTDLTQPASKIELEQMLNLLNMALSQGAKGLSSGLAYENAHAAPRNEIAVLVKQLKRFDAIYSTHLRTEFDHIIEALDEAFEVGKSADVPVVISHLKCAGKNNWGRSREILDHIEANQKNQKISCDCYPYNASSSTLDLQQVTDDFKIFITWSEPHPEMAEQTLEDIAKQWKTSLMDAAKRLQPAGAVYHGIAEEDVRQIIAAPFSMIGSDGLPCDPHPHPRLWGTFPRVLGHYSRDKKVLTLAQAVHKMTGLSATQFKLNQRGFIRQGYFADLVLFDANNVQDMASFAEPCTVSKGIIKVWVNGKLTYQFQGNSQNIEGAGRFLAHKL
jgi:N-acyl-D-aspartate/D-glutamate deacylase